MLLIPVYVSVYRNLLLLLYILTKETKCIVICRPQRFTCTIGDVCVCVYLFIFRNNADPRFVCKEVLFVLCFALTFTYNFLALMMMCNHLGWYFFSLDIQLQSNMLHEIHEGERVV